MKQLPDARTLSELLEMGKSIENQARKVYEMAEAFAQKYQSRLQQNQPTKEKEVVSD